MTKTRDWQRNKEMWIRVLEKQTGEGLTAWNRKIRKQTFDGELQLRRWRVRRERLARDVD